jgi:hypothetical protein
MREFVERAGGVPLSAEADTGLLQRLFDPFGMGHRVDLEADIVGRGRADQRLRQHAVLGLATGELGRVPRQRLATVAGEDGHPDQVQIDEQRFTGNQRVPNRGEIERVARTAEECVGNPEPCRRRLP